MTKVTERERAQLASLSRVAACLINEHLVQATFAGDTITIRHPKSNDEVTIGLCNVSVGNGYVHPTDITHQVRHSGGELVTDGASLMKLFGKWADVDVRRVCQELENCVENQQRTYSKPRDLDIHSPAIEWEQAVVEGDSIHPWHKCRFPVVDDFTTTRIHFVVAGFPGVEVVGTYNEWMGKVLAPDIVDANQNGTIIPVHELQLPTVQQLYPGIKVLPQTVIGRPQSSLRTISLPGTTDEICIKIPVPIKVTSIVRTIRPWAITIGHRLGPILQLLEEASRSFGGSLITTREYGAAKSETEHLGCLIRESSESISARTGDRVIVCAALAENIGAVWDELADRPSVLREYCYHLFRAVLPSVFLHGFALQAHLQNLLVRLDPETKEIKGFVARDFGSFRVHSATFLETTSLDIDTSWVLTGMDTLEKVYCYILSVVHGHVGRMSKALDLGMGGWKIALEELQKVIPPKNEMARQLWLERPTRVARAHVSMQLYGVKTECTSIQVPNLFYHARLN